MLPVRRYQASGRIPHKNRKNNPVATAKSCIVFYIWPVNISSANTVSYRRLFFSASDCFLDGSGSPHGDIQYFIQVPENVSNALQEFYTLLVDLRQPEETLWKNIYHRTRTEIGSFITNQSYDYQLKMHLTEPELTQFTRLFNRFSKHKGIRAAEAFRLRAYNRAGLLAVSFIRQSNEYICINFYRVNQQRASNIYSFHRGHELNKLFNSTHIGRAHRALHWLDMLEFKQAGIGTYDLCGWYAGNSDRALLNINAFKEQFSQNKVKEYSGVIYRSFLLRVLLRLHALLRKAKESL